MITLWHNNKQDIYKEYIKSFRSCDNHLIDHLIKEIMEKYNTNPLFQKNDNEYYEGYWFSGDKYNEKYPIPIISKTPTNKKFIEKLKDYCSYVKLCEKKFIELYSNKNIFVCDLYTTSYMGYSTCRFCNKLNGSVEYYVRHQNNKIYFPEGLIHYYEDHNVHPSSKFYEAVMDVSFSNMEKYLDSPRVSWHANVFSMLAGCAGLTYSS